MIIAITGKKQGGKDAVTKIIQKLLSEYNTQNKKFATKLKKIVCELIDCTMEELEDEGFKNSYLDPEWWVYECGDKIIPYSEGAPIEAQYVLRKTTPRNLMQNLGTQCVRQLVHPNAWITTTLKTYNPQDFWVISDLRFPNEVEAIKRKCPESKLIQVIRLKTAKDWYQDNFSKWVEFKTKTFIPSIFFNHYAWGQEKITIETFITRLELMQTHIEFSKEFFDFIETIKNPSETALDSFEDFDDVIYNDGSLEDLELEVQALLTKYNFIQI